MLNYRGKNRPKAAENDNTKNYNIMKQKYVIPDLDIQFITPGSKLLATSTNGENLSTRTYGDREGENVDDFWM